MLEEIRRDSVIASNKRGDGIMVALCHLETFDARYHPQKHP